MRCRLTLAAVGLALAGTYTIWTPVAEAQERQSDDEAYGELIPGGAGVGVTDREFQPGEQAPAARRTPSITCRFVAVGLSGDVPESELRQLYDAAVARGEDHILVYRTCVDSNGEAIRIPGQQDAGDPIAWAPGQGDALIDPALLADIARSSLEFPVPSGDTSPPLGAGTFAQLPTYFRVDNWGPVDASASAGSVTATVTATPASQAWTITDTLRQTTYSFSCDGPGVEFDPSNVATPPAGACSWEPPHSSAGQSQTSSTGEACFPATVTVTWNVSWDSNITEPATLGTGTRAASTCIVVQEIQAVVTDG